MNSAKKFFFKLALFLGIGFSSVYGYDCCQYYCSNPNPLGTGFMVGVYGSFHTVFFNVRDRETDGEDPDFRFLARYDMIQEAPGGGGFISYGCAFCDRFVAAVRFDAIGLAENAEHGYSEWEVGDNFLHELALRWIVDLTFQPGILIGNCSLAYFKIGGTLGGVREQVWIKNFDEPYDVTDKKTKCHYPGGYVLGAGVNFLLMNCYTFFVEYDWHSYTSRLSSLGVVDLDNNISLDRRVTNLHSNSFSFGIGMTF